MINTKRNKSSSLFLIELMLAILFFIVVSSICVLIFVKSHTLNKKADDLNCATLVVNNIVETSNGSQSISDAISLIKKDYPNINIQKTNNNDIISFNIYLDENGNEIQNDNYYAVIVNIKSDTNRILGDVSFYLKDEKTPILSEQINTNIRRRVK